MVLQYLRLPYVSYAIERRRKFLLERKDDSGAEVIAMITNDSIGVILVVTAVNQGQQISQNHRAVNSRGAWRREDPWSFPRA